MDNPIIIAIVAIVVGAIIGYIIAKTLEKNNASKLIKSAKKSAASIVKEANHDGESIKKDKILQAKEKFIELKSEHEKVILSRDKKMAETEKRIRDKESQISNELAKAKKINDDFEAKTVETSEVYPLISGISPRRGQLSLCQILLEKAREETKETMARFS